MWQTKWQKSDKPGQRISWRLRRKLQNFLRTENDKKVTVKMTEKWHSRQKKFQNLDTDKKVTVQVTEKWHSRKKVTEKLHKVTIFIPVVYFD